MRTAVESSSGVFKSRGACYGVVERMTFRFWIIWLWLAAGWPLGARMAWVRTQAGHRYEGQVRLAADGLILANALQDLRVQIPLAELVTVSFAEEVVAAAQSDPTADLPYPWRQADVGSVLISGGVLYRDGVYTLQSAGRRIGGTEDSFHYVYQPAHGDMEIEACLDSVHRTDPQARGGLMMREGLGDYAKQVTFSLTALRNVALQWRSQEHAAAQGFEAAAPSPSCWLRLKREGNEFTASFSRNGRQWVMAQRMELPMNQSYEIGLALAGIRPGAVNWTDFHRVRAASVTGNGWLSPRVDLTSGSTVRGQLGLAEPTLVTLWNGTSELRVPTAVVAGMLLQDWPWPPPGNARNQRAGVWLANGDFVDGDFQRIEKCKLQVNSVLFGPRWYDIETEVFALALRPKPTDPAACEVETLSGAVWRVPRLGFEDNEVHFLEPALGAMRIPIQALREIRFRH